MRSRMLIFLLCIVLVGCGLPSDEKLKKEFQGNEADFQKLISMTKEDSHLTRIAQNFTWLDNDASWPRKDPGLTEERWNQYRRLFRELDLDGGLVRAPDNSSPIFFIAGTEGIFVSGGSYKGYAYSTSPVSPVIDSLDSLPEKVFDKKGRALAFKPLTKNWYIYREEY